MTTGGPTAPGDEPTPGSGLLGGRYELETVLGYGGMAVVRLGTDRRLGRAVAVKILRGELAEAPAFQARFRREARAAAALNHPGIVSVYDAGEDTVDDRLALYIVMEYVEGHTLRDLLLTGPQPASRSLEITADVLDALDESHRAGIVHRDVKPANVMVTPAGAVKVMDFGVARAVADMSASLTQTSAVIGTAHYLSPEQARGEDVDARSDVYSTGCLLYELLTGRPPFVGDSAIAVAYQHVREPAQRPSALQASVPAAVDAVVMTALAKQPDERYESAAQMRQDIVAVLAGEPPAAVVPLGDTADLQPAAGAIPPALVGATVAAEADTPVAASGSRRRRRAAVLAGSVATVLAAVLGGFALTGSSDLADRAPRTESERVGGRTTQSPGPQEEPASAGLETGGFSDDGLDREPVTRERPRRIGKDAEPRPTEPADSQTPDDAAEDRPEPEQQPAPESTPTSEPSAEEPTPEETQSESPAPESTEPAPSTPEEPAATTTSADGT